VPTEAVNDFVDNQRTKHATSRFAAQSTSTYARMRGLPAADPGHPHRVPLSGCLSAIGALTAGFFGSEIMGKTLSAALAALALAASPAFGQESGLVNVSVTNVANNLAQNLKVNVSQIPVTVQVPVEVAANVCGIDANVLSEQAKAGSANCAAKNTSTALNEVVQQQLKKG
jgi:hypothetical protein